MNKTFRYHQLFILASLVLTSDVINDRLIHPSIHPSIHLSDVTPPELLLPPVGSQMAEARCGPVRWLGQSRGGTAAARQPSVPGPTGPLGCQFGPRPKASLKMLSAK